MGIIDKLNKDFESRVRLGIMSILMVNDWVDFTEMKTLLDITDVNFEIQSTFKSLNYEKTPFNFCLQFYFYTAFLQ